jgi:enterochelin esterase-like enzyme
LATSRARPNELAWFHGTSGAVPNFGFSNNFMKSTLPFVAAILSIAFASSVHAQRSGAPQIESPKVHPDRKVTFTFRAPSAKRVELSAQFLRGNQVLNSDSNGVWSVTVGPVEPNLYPYHFVVDGVSVSDPSNTDLFPNERFKGSLVDIPGDEPSLHSAQDVPHGEVRYCSYNSKTVGGIRPVLVYTPPGYREGNARYPVFYLVSGTTDTEETWFKVGRVNFILDNLIAQKRAVPMIVVMPYGNMMRGTPGPATLQAAEMYKVFADELTGSVMPFVEKQYRVIPEREKRAIAGFSRGGGQSLFTGFSHLDKFGWIGSYSAYLTPEVFNKYFPEFADKPESLNQQLKLLWLGVGKEDFLYQQAVAFDEFLKEKKIEHKSLVTGGGHTWMNARHYLIETLQLYFK